MTRFIRLILGLAVILSGSPQPVLAGMPSPELIWTELGRRRWEEVSFFLVGFLLMAAIVRLLWNMLRHDFPSLPKLSYRGSVSLLLLWGLLMAVVLAMVSGARELMTPGAWVPKGVTYKLADNQPHQSLTPAENELRDQRRRHKLDNLRFALWQFASAHEGRFPSVEEAETIAPDLWLVDGNSPLRFVYVPGKGQQQTNEILVYEPEVFDDDQYVILASGAITKRNEIIFKKSPETSTETNGNAVPSTRAVGPVNTDRPSDSNGGP